MALSYSDFGLKQKSKGFEKLPHKVQPMLYFMRTFDAKKPQTSMSPKRHSSLEVHKKFSTAELVQQNHLFKNQAYK